MRSRLLALLVGTGVAVGGSAAAWAESSRPDGARRDVVRACKAEARDSHPDADGPALREAVKACLEAAGVKPGGGRELTPEQQAKRDALRTCVEGVKAAHPDAEKAELRKLARPCFAQAGVRPGRMRGGPARAKARECLAEVRRANPDLDKAALRPLVADCMRAKSGAGSPP